MDIFSSTEYSVPAYKPINESAYSLLYKKCSTELESSALSYFKKEISFGELFKKIDKTAAALSKLGIGEGDVVIVSLPSIPEAVALFYAINKIGAIFCGMDCRIKAGEIAEIIDHVKPKACFVADFHIGEFKNIDSVPIICVSFIKTISLFAGFCSFFAGIFTGRYAVVSKKKNLMSYQKFLSDGKNYPVPAMCMPKNDISAYFYTSGTTYGRKCVVLTNENINSAVMQYALSQPGIDETDRFCTIMPLFTCYGITLGTHLPLILKKQVRMIPLFNGKNMKSLLLKEKPGYITTVPSHWEYFVKDDFKGIDLSFFKGAIVGGDKLSTSHENRINDILKKCGSSGKVMRGYGLTEAATAVTAQLEDTPKGSVGTNMCWSTIGIFNIETDTPLPDGEKGEICVCGPNICKGYLEDEEATSKLLKRHSDGKIWMHSGDIGYFDSDHHLYFCERVKRIFVRFDGTKVSPYAIEQQLCKCPVVSQCMVYSMPDTEHEHGRCPGVLVVLDKEDNAYNTFKEYISNKIAYHLRPVKISEVDSIPTTGNGKFDYFIYEHSKD